MPATHTLPPPKLMRAGLDAAADVHRDLTAVIAGHPGAIHTYTFYEVLDDWLGPWGSRGYPIAYGKFYNILFTQNEHIQANPAAARWLWRTTILLQEELRDFVVRRVREGTIHHLSEPELRAAAFESHPRAYTDAGLATVTLVAPELVPIITSIPGREFSPAAENFGPTVKQVIRTIRLVAPGVAGHTLATLAGPAHTGVLRLAVQRDLRQQLNDIALGRELSGMKQAIDRGDVDYIPALDALVDGLNAREFPDQGFARFARDVVEAALARRRHLQAYYERALQESPEVRQRVHKKHPELLRVR